MGLLASSAGNPCSEGPCSRGIGGILIAVGAVATVSAAYGFHTVKECRTTIDNQRACRDGDATACLRLKGEPKSPPPTPSDTATAGSAP